MFGIGQFFKRIQTTYNKEVLGRLVVVETIKKVTGADITVDQVSFKGTIVNLDKLNQSLRSVIFIKKQSILNEINKLQTERVITDIK